MASFFRLASELHNVLGPFFYGFEHCPGFVSYQSDAYAGEQGFFRMFPGCILIQAGEDAGDSYADEELAPGDFVGVFPLLLRAETVGPVLPTSWTGHAGVDRTSALRL